MFDNAFYYHHNATLQQKIAKDFVLFSQISSYGNVLDIGCGTGFVAIEMHKNGFYGKVDGIDASANMLSLATKTKMYNKLTLADINNYDFSTHKKQYTAVVSSMCLQWANDVSSIFTHLSQIAPSYIAIPSNNSLQSLRYCFESIGITTPILTFPKPKIKPNKSVIYKEEYQSIIACLKQINKIGAKVGGFKLPSYSQIKSAEELFKKEVEWEIDFYHI